MVEGKNDNSSNARAPRATPVNSSRPAGAFDPCQTHRIFSRPYENVHATSDALGWRNIYASTQREGHHTASYDGVAHHLLVLHRTGPVRTAIHRGGLSLSKDVLADTCSLLPGGEGFSVDVDEPVESAHLYLRRELVDTVIAERAQTRTDIGGLRPFLGAVNPLLTQLLTCLADQLYAEQPAALYVDCLAWAMAAHLVESTVPDDAETIRRTKSGLNERQWRRVDSFIDTHLGEDIGLDELSRAAALSPIYFARQFKRRTGMSPYRYLSTKRVARAKALLSNDHMSIAEIALACGFSHQEHLTNVFRLHCGITPAAFRRSHTRR